MKLSRAGFYKIIGDDRFNAGWTAMVVSEAVMNQYKSHPHRIQPPDLPSAWAELVVDPLMHLATFFTSRARRDPTVVAWNKYWSDLDDKCFYCAVLMAMDRFDLKPEQLDLSKEDIAILNSVVTTEPDANVFKTIRDIGQIKMMQTTHITTVLLYA